MATHSSESEAAVRAVEAAYDEAWLRGDVDALMAFFTDDAVLVNPRGAEAAGTSQIRAAFESLFANEAQGSAHTSNIVRVTFVTDDVAVVDGEAVIEGFREDSSTPAVFTHKYIDVLVRAKGTWRISQIRA